MRWRAILAASALIALPACNNVVSVDPWFTEADTQGVPSFRDGLWLSADDDCKVDTAKPAERWPDCADASFVRGNERFSMHWETVDDGRRKRRAFAGWGADPSLIANGDPLIAQFEWAALSDASEVPETSSEDVIESGEKHPWRYIYLAIRPTAFDHQGNVTAFETWAIRCGPVPESAPDEEIEDVTETPFPGLTVVENNCTADSVDALRRAALLSNALDARRQTRWVREGWR